MTSLLSLSLIYVALASAGDTMYTQRWRNEARSGPGAYFALKGTLNKGVAVTTGKVDGDWVELNAPVKGWMAKSSLGAVAPKEGGMMDAFNRLRSKLTPQKANGAAIAAVRGFALRHGRGKAAPVDDFLKQQGPFFTPDEFQAFKRADGAPKASPGAASKEQLNDYDPTLQEEGAGLGIASSVAAKGLDKDPELRRYLNLLAAVLAEASGAYATPFRLYVTTDKPVNALSVPGGWIFLSKRLIAACQNEAELAAVIAHEMSHITKKHGLKELKKREGNLRAEAAMAEMEAEAGEGPDPDAEAELNDFADTAYESVHKPRLQSYEEEADRGAMIVLARAGYDASAVPRMIERVGAAVVKEQSEGNENPFAKMDYKARKEKADVFLKTLPSSGATNQPRFQRYVRN